MVKLKWWEKYIEKTCAEVVKNLSKCRFENNFVESSKKKRLCRMFNSLNVKTFCSVRIMFEIST